MMSASLAALVQVAVLLAQSAKAMARTLSTLTLASIVVLVQVLAL